MQDKYIHKMFLFIIQFCVLFFLVSVGDTCAEDIISKGSPSISGTLTLPADTTVIEDYAFYGCTSLTGPLNIPASVTSIGDYAFANCNGLSGRLTVPENVKSIGEGVFFGCNQFDKVFVQIPQADGTMISVERTAVYCSPDSYAWIWAEEQDDFEPVAISVWPERAIELIVPANPGGDTDSHARALAAALKEEMGWNVIVTNMVGGSGSVAFKDCLSNPGDGYRYVFYHNGSINTELMGMYDFDIINDFKLAGMPFMDYSNAFLSNASNKKFNDLPSMLVYMRNHPKEVTFATEIGSFTHVQMLAFEKATGVKFEIVDAGTASQKIVELAGNRLDVIAAQAGLGSVRDYETKGEFICLGTFSEKPIQMGDITLKSFKEQGVDVIFSKFFYLAAPNTVDDAIIAKMNNGLQKAITNQSFKDYCYNVLVEESYTTPMEAEIYYNNQKNYYSIYLSDIIDSPTVTPIPTPTPIPTSTPTSTNTTLDGWPERAIELVVPANPGGDTDNNARALAAALKEEMGWNVIVSNMSGGSGAVAFKDALANPDDGYRFVFYHSGACITQMMEMYDTFNVLDDFKLAGMPILDYSNAFISNAENEKFSDLPSMIAYMKDHPGEVTFATETGSFIYLHMLALEADAGVEFSIVDAGTAAQKITELLGKRLDIIGTQASLVRDYVTTNQFKVLGVMAENELQLGDVTLQTCKEQGFDIVFSKFFYLAAPNCVDDDIINIMNEGLKKAVKNARFQEYARNALLNLTNMTPAEAESYYQNQYELYDSYLLE